MYSIAGIFFPGRVVPALWNVWADALSARGPCLRRRRAALLPLLLAPLWLLVAGYAQAAAKVISPVAGSTLTTSTITLRWQADPKAIAYAVSVGSSIEGLVARKPGNLAYLPARTATSLQVLNIPLNGQPVYLRVWSKTATGWEKSDVSYRTVIGEQDRPGSITAPAAPGPLATGSVLEWSGHGVDEYIVTVGATLESVSTKPGKSFDHYRGAATSIMLKNLPEDGSPLYVRLRSRILNKWFIKDYVYQSGRVGPAMLSLNWPSPAAPLDQQAKRFSWAPVVGATEYVFTLASSPDLLVSPLHADIFSRTTTDTEMVATGIPLDGKAVYTRLWALVNDKWFTSDAVYATTYAPGPPDYEAECLERHWQKVSLDVQGKTRDLLWREPDTGRWDKGAIILLHGGAGASSNWCGAGATREMSEFSRSALAAGFAVFALNADSFNDEWGQSCGKRFDGLSPAATNRDLPYIKEVLTSTIGGLRPPDSSSKIFMAGISSGAFMTLRAATHFDSRVAAFAAAASADPNGMYIYCADTSGHEDRPGFYADIDSRNGIAAPGACGPADYANEKPWETENPAIRPRFKLLHHRNDAVVDLSCMERAHSQLVAHGYKDDGTFLLGDGVNLDSMTHFWQEEYNAEILKFFTKVAGE